MIFASFFVLRDEELIAMDCDDDDGKADTAQFTYIGTDSSPKGTSSCTCWLSFGRFLFFFLPLLTRIQNRARLLIVTVTLLRTNCSTLNTCPDDTLDVADMMHKENVM